MSSMRTKMPVEVSLTKDDTLSRERVSFSTSRASKSLAVNCSRHSAWKTARSKVRMMSSE